MAKEFRFPDLGEGVAEGELVKWLVKTGDVVQEDQEVAEVETDKALVSIPSPFAGQVETLNFKEGEKVKVGSVLMTFRDVAERAKPAPVAAPKPAAPTEAAKPSGGPEKAPTPAKPSAPEPVSETSTPIAPRSDRASFGGGELPILATPYVRKLARELGVGIEQIRGTGENGRITEADVRRHTRPEAKGPAPAPLPAPSPKAESPPETKDDAEKFGPVERVPIKGIRRKISEHMLLALQQTVMVTHIDEAQVDALIQLREKKKKFAEERGVKLTLLPFLIKACVIALKNYPYLNASLIDEAIVLKKYFHFGFAVDTEAGLIVPVIRDADQKSIMRIATELSTLSAKARDRSISREELQGHSFSITNIGSIGGKACTPILHYPDSAILGLGRTYQKPVVVNDEIKIASVLPLCLTFDHRVSDGATAARFVNDVIRYLGDPDLLLLDDGEA